MCVARVKRAKCLKRTSSEKSIFCAFWGLWITADGVLWSHLDIFWGKNKKNKSMLIHGSIIFKLHIYFDYYQGYSDNILCRFSFVKGPRNKQRYRLISHSFVNRLTDLNSSILTMPMRSFSSISTNTSFHWSSLNTTGTCNSMHNFFYHGNWSSRFDRNELCNISPYLRFDETKQAR